MSGLKWNTGKLYYSTVRANSRRKFLEKGIFTSEKRATKAKLTQEHIFFGCNVTPWARVRQSAHRLLCVTQRLYLVERSVQSIL